LLFRALPHRCAAPQQRDVGHASGSPARRRRDMAEPRFRVHIGRTVRRGSRKPWLRARRARGTRTDPPPQVGATPCAGADESRRTAMTARRSSMFIAAAIGATFCWGAGMTLTKLALAHFEPSLL